MDVIKYKKPKRLLEFGNNGRCTKKWELYTKVPFPLPLEALSDYNGLWDRRGQREGISLRKLVRMFPDDDAARAWFESKIWPDGPYCPRCGSFNVQAGIKHKSMTHRCRDCAGKPRFSLKSGNIMEGSKLGYQTWAIAIYLVMTNLKGVSSMKLHRDLEITQKSAWHLAHRLRKAFEAGRPTFAGPAEADESYWGGKETNKHAHKKLRAGRGTVGKTPVVGIRDRATGQVDAQVAPDTRAETLQRFVVERTADGATVYTDEAAAYKGMPGRKHEAVRHSAGEYVRGMASTNGVESFWAMLRRGHDGTFHHFSRKHLGRYVSEFSGRHNIREADTIDMMETLAVRSVGKWLRYRELISG